MRGAGRRWLAKMGPVGPMILCVGLSAVACHKKAAPAAPPPAPMPDAAIVHAPDAHPAEWGESRPSCGRTCDLSTDEGVSAAYAAQVGSGLDLAHKKCLHRGGKDIVALGVLQVGICRPDGAFAACCFGDARASAPKLLEAIGWAGATPAKRAELATRWVIDAVLAFDDVIRKGPDAPTARAADGGGVTVTVWVRRETTEERLEIDVSAAGQIAAPRTMASRPKRP